MTKCEWCGESYPNKTWDEHFWRINLFGKHDHIICDCCKKHLIRLDKYEYIKNLRISKKQLVKLEMMMKLSLKKY